ncbi:hypothetical protein [Acinetobacter johnsonii]|uniref:hypothetical protein n=1 Tax=Acinetobacter johnsonii TaxID=40214 RepID=UPI0011E63C92|nr:hypothetical protein [Acinetobacter johnsonii]QEK35870.1 hypothetical protein FYN22_08290 [Acinetobacter johnsonii]
MADQIVTRQELIGAHYDALTLGDCINGPANTKVTSRLDRTYWTLATIDYLVQQGQIKIEDLQEAIDIALAAGAGAAGWTADLIAYGDKTQKQVNDVLTNGYAYVEWFGDTSTDATNAINMCLLYCRNYNKTAKSISNKVYPISDTIVIQSSCDFAKSKFEAPSSLAKPAIQITNRGSGLTHIRARSIKLPELTNNRELGVVPTVGSIGVQILGGMRNCDVVFDNIYGFEENLQLKSDTPNNDEFIAYNKFTFNGLIAGSKVNVHLWIANTGWVNQCTWIGGQFARYSQDQAAFDTVNLKISKSTSTGNNPPNGHTFVGCAMEGAFTQTIEYVLHADISTSYFASNTFFNCRFEQATSMKFSPLALYDTFIGCYGLNEVAFVDEVRPTIIGSPRTGHLFFDIAAIVGATGSRTAKNTFMYTAGNSSSAMPLTVGFNKMITGGLQASGGYVMFHPTNATLLQPLVRIALDGGSPSILMGDGATAPTEKLFRYASNDWRHTFNLRPSTDLGSQLGTASNRYKELHVQDVSIYPPAANNPTANGEMTFELTSDTQLKVKVRGSDGLIRSATLTLV